MASYLSNLLTQTTTKYNSIRRNLLSNEDDGDNENDSHISRVLIAYYNEQPDRSWPDFLPAEARKMPNQQPQSQGAGALAGYASIWANSSSNANTGTQSLHQSPNVGSANKGRGGALDDLWDSSPQRPSSARAPASSASNQSFGGGMYGSQQQSAYGQSSTYSRPGVNPLRDQSPPGSSHSVPGVGLSARDRLKARYGNR